MLTIPNRTNFVGKVISIGLMPDNTDRISLEIEIIDSPIQKDLRFIKPQAKFNAICFVRKEFLDKEVFILAEGEYLGGPHGGKLIIHDYIQYFKSGEEE